MKPQIIKKEKLILAGLSFYGDPFKSSDCWTDENEIGRLWSRFLNYIKKNKNRFKDFKKIDCMYEVHLQDEEMFKKGEHEVFVGAAIKSIDDVPYDLLVKIFPPSLYAVFTLKGEMITSDWSSLVYNNWLPETDYKNNGSYIFQVYDEKFKGMDKIEESMLDIYVPVINNKG